ncbi:NlpC/P60 family protein [Pseudorhodobacter antarcticus]|uniref:NlpC/P60 family protein n=1 Tax=Pseudorhodobacter antarcticus TaxID=1077947 RepID=A0A1H8AMZ0_9RHOB|nr:NlpC/P60 family protein [Pseudorhodobacter antarcticus]SEM70887.1 NlpC/P60 family protein [Pseudorhodobacter antarcticus]
MTDRRLTLANDRVAHIALQGTVNAPAYADAAPYEVAVPLVDLLRAQDGPRDRQLNLGDRFEVIELLDGMAFGRATKDGYCGYVPEAALSEPTRPTHWLAARASHLYSEPRAQAPQSMSISFGARLCVVGQTGNFAETPHGFVPAGHLRPIGQWFHDPVEVAALFVGTPYLWGGNGHAGVDCSGLVQLSLHACGRTCPGDSDMQQALGAEVPDGAPMLRGDLLFWKDHVAMVVDIDLMIHATGAFMAVVVEPMAVAIARIIASGGGAITARRRVG